MQNTTEKKWAPIACALVMVVLLGVLLGVFLAAVLGEVADDTVGKIILAVYSIFILAVIFGILAALRQRLKEIDGGEEADAKQY